YPAGLAEDHLADQVGEEEALALAGIARRVRLLGAEAAGQRTDQLVDRRALLRTGREIEAAQRGVGVVARRLEDSGEELEDRLLERCDLAREAEDLHPRCRVGLVLQPIDHRLVEPGDQ